MNERQQFEAWVSASGRAHMLEREKPHGWYKDLTVTAWWTAWQASRRAALEEACAAIKAEDDRQHDNDYMLDSDDCIRVVRALADGDTNNG